MQSFRRNSHAFIMLEVALSCALQPMVVYAAATPDQRFEALSKR